MDPCASVHFKKVCRVINIRTSNCFQWIVVRVFSIDMTFFINAYNVFGYRPECVKHEYKIGWFLRHPCTFNPLNSKYEYELHCLIHEFGL